MNERYVVIVEYKDEAPSILETAHQHFGYEAACKRMEEMGKRPDVIRVAMAKLVFERGNRSLVTEAA